jgi:O-acetyl-ADP-ribose deacetylase (regulator of RNase III)
MGAAQTGSSPDGEGAHTRRLAFVIADIRAFGADAIVNAANSDLRHTGGIAQSIARAADPMLIIESRSAPFLPTGEARATIGGGRLRAAHVIHVAGPPWEGGGSGEARLLDLSYRNALRLAGEMGLRSIAFPSVATGIYRYPLALAAPVAVRALSGGWEDEPQLESVTMCLVDERHLKAYEGAYERLLRAKARPRRPRSE